MKDQNTNDANAAQQDWVALNTWLNRLGRSETTGYRWRKRGWLKTTIIAGKHYLSAQQQREFELRAAAGEFAKVASADVRHSDHPSHQTVG